MFPLPLLSETQIKRTHRLAGALFTRHSTFPGVNMRPAGAAGTANLADVFISCSRLDRDRVQPIAERLGSLGYSVWWDAREGQANVDEIQRQYDDARAVVTVWTDAARNSSWVLAQSANALDQDKLLQMRLDSIRLPSPFEALKVAEMHSGKSEWGMLEDALARLVREGRPPETIDHRALENTRANMVAAPRLLLVAIVTSLFAFAMAVTTAMNGVIRPDQLEMALIGVLVVGGFSTIVVGQRLFSIRRAGG